MSGKGDEWNLRIYAAFLFWEAVYYLPSQEGDGEKTPMMGKKVL